jgi:hypothetical protein
MRMRRSFSARIVTGLWAAWLGVAIVEPAAVHSCPVHASGAAAHHSVAAPVAGEHQHHQSSQEQKPAQCSCIGECSAAQSVAAPTFASVEVAVAEIAAPTVVVSFADEIAPAAQPSYAHPFATAPPA